MSAGSYMGQEGQPVTARLLWVGDRGKMVKVEELKANIALLSAELCHAMSM